MDRGYRALRTYLRIRELAKEKGFSLNRLSRASDVDLTTLQRLVRDPSTQGVTLYTLVKLADTLGVRLSELIEEMKES